MVKLDEVSEAIGHLVGKVDALKCDTKEIKDHLKTLNSSVAENKAFRITHEKDEKRTRWVTGIAFAVLGLIFTGVNIIISHVGGK